MKKTTQNPFENIAEERVVIGRLLHSPSSFWLVSDVLQPFHFARPVHREIYGAIKDILTEGKKLSLTLIQARIGDEYSEGGDDGLSTMALMTALLRDAENGDLEGVEVLVDLWKRRAHLEELRRAIKAAEKPDEAHIDDLISEHGARLEDITLSGQTTPIRTIGEAAAEVMDYSAKAQTTGVLSGFDTGLPSLDEILGRINPTDLGAIIAARGDAKTVLAVQLGEHMQKRAPGILFELEMRDMDLASRALAGQTGHSVQEIESGQFDQWALQDLLSAKERLMQSRLYIDDRPKLSIEQIYDRCKALKRSKGIGWAIIDHFRLVRTSKRLSDKFERMEYVSGELKAMAKDLEIAVIVLSQRTRMSQRREDHPEPQLNDADGGGALEQDIDWGIGLFRRDRWLRPQKPYETESKEFRAWADKMTRHKDRIEIYNLKGRRVADGEMREFHFDGRGSLIKEIEK